MWPHVGLLRFEVINTWLQPHTGTRMLIYTPADTETRHRLEQLAELIETNAI
jgi:hypothetical protein